MLTRLKLIVFCLMFAMLFISFACKTTTPSNPSMMIGQISAATAEEAAIYGILDQLKTTISKGQWEEWLSLYSDDAVLTLGDKKVGKGEMLAATKGAKYKISEMEVLDKEIGEKDASVSVRFVGNGQKHLETYNLKKMAGIWKIVEERNP